MMSDWRRLAAATHPYNTTRGHDHLAWAKRIMLREQHRDPELMAIQVTFAKQALGLVDKAKP
jgi:hypothetical protein